MSIISRAKDSFLAKEPAMALAGAGAAVSFAVTTLETHGVINGVQASSLTQTLAPPVAAVFLLGLGWVGRHLVSPAAAFAERVEAEVQKRLDSLPGAVITNAATGQILALPVADDGSTAAKIAAWTGGIPDDGSNEPA